MGTVTVPITITIEGMSADIEAEAHYTYAPPYQAIGDEPDFCGHADVYSVTVAHPMLPATETVHLLPNIILAELEQIAWEAENEETEIETEQ